jgi:hypothetical protein
MFDSFGDGWGGTQYVIISENGTLSAIGALLAGASQTDELCLEDGCYTMSVGGGAFDSEVSWTLNGADGGSISGLAPQTVSFWINTLPADCTPATPLVVTGGVYTAEELITDVFLGDCLEASNILYTGAANAIGTFSNGGPIGIEEGIILTTGDINNAPGPNLSTATTAGNGTAGDLLLDGLAGSITYDAAVFTFDFVANTDQVTFTYVFASEEYPEWVCSTFNDAFGFFVTGPGYAANTNIAAVPGTGDIVSINNVNDVGACPPTYPQYYQNNLMGSVIEFDGYTVPMEAVINTVPCETYQIKIAVADAGDAAYDSAVLLMAESFTAGVNVSVAATSAAGNQSEPANCDPGGSFIFANEGLEFTEEVTINFLISGSAVEGVDFEPISGSVTFQPGDTFTTLDIEGILAGLTTTPESIILTLTDYCTCLAPPSITLYICLPLMLGVDWLDFVAASDGLAGVRCLWSTAEEENNELFTVQRSSNAIHWIDIGNLPGAGNSFSAKQYEFLDRLPLEGVSYYRIRQTDWNGSSSFSEVRAVTHEIEELSIYPNPGAGKFRILGYEGGQIEVLDSRGRVVESELTETGQLMLMHARPGVYTANYLRPGNDTPLFVRFIVR